MQRERVADDIYVFISDQYAQVNATLITTNEGAVLFDTLLYPDETRQIHRYVERRLGTTVKVVINSHFHADHTAGTCFFPNAQVIAHAKCRDLLERRGRESLEQAKQHVPELRDVELVLPDTTFRESYQFSLGNKSFHLWSTPGHSPDSVVCLVKEDRVLLAADTVMALPHFVDGSFDELYASLQSLRGGNYENVIQGHGDIVLRGEIEDRLKSDIAYLDALRKAVDHALEKGQPLDNIDIERCGKSRILLHGSAVELHRQNVMTLAAQRRELLDGTDREIVRQTP
ncbi:MAG: MBL fold metallo-hydrolase [Anaerolineae bacterium]|nr:MBL fold metallo-hydrolase [Anaerolineae bacterium]